MDQLCTPKNLSRIFILKFRDEELPLHLWPLLEGELRHYQPETEGAEIRAEVLMVDDGNYINLNIDYPVKSLKITDQEIDRDLEKFKDEFEEFYLNLIETMDLNPLSPEIFPGDLD